MSATDRTSTLSSTRGTLRAAPTTVDVGAEPDPNYAGEVYKDAKGRDWMIMPVGGKFSGMSDEAHAALVADTRDELIGKIDDLSASRGYATLAIIGAGIAVALWWLFKEIKP